MHVEFEATRLPLVDISNSGPVRLPWVRLEDVHRVNDFHWLITIKWHRVRTIVELLRGETRRHLGRLHRVVLSLKRVICASKEVWSELVD